MNKNKIREAMPTVLFACGIVGIFVAEVMVARDTLKAERIIKEKDIHRIIAVEETEELAPGVTSTVGVHLEKRPLKEYAPEVIKASWKCYIPTMVTTTLTLSALIASRTLTAKQIALLSSAVASTGSLVTKYRKAILDRTNEDILHEIDREVASATMKDSRPPVIETSHLLSTGVDDLSDDGECLFFDPFTKLKFRSTKLAVMGAKYYLNRNFSLGSEAPLSMFYAFLGVALPEEYSYAGWDVSEMADNGYYWIDIDCVKSDKPDPETGEYYYILEYDLLPGDTDDNYYPFGNPLSTEGSYAV